MANAKEKTYDYLFKIVLVGNHETYTGKAGLIHRLSNPTASVSDIDKASALCFGADFILKTIDIDGKKVKLQIWDAKGGERFHYCIPSYTRRANSCIMVYDVTNKKTFDSVTEYPEAWIERIRNSTDADTQIALLGYKCHLDDKRQVSKEMGEKLAAEHEIRFMECSAETNYNVEECFMTLARGLKEQEDSRPKSEVDKCTKENIKEANKNKSCSLV